MTSELDATPRSKLARTARSGGWGCPCVRVQVKPSRRRVLRPRQACAQVRCAAPRVTHRSTPRAATIRASRVVAPGQKPVRSTRTAKRDRAGSATRLGETHSESGRQLRCMCRAAKNHRGASPALSRVSSSPLAGSVSAALGRVRRPAFAAGAARSLSLRAGAAANRSAPRRCLARALRSHGSPRCSRPLRSAALRLPPVSSGARLRA